MADLVMRKRAAMHAGEIGLFIDTQVFEEEFASIKQGVDVSVEAKQSRNLKQMRLAWGLCRKIADSGVLGDADTREVMNYLLKKSKHVKYVANQHRDGVEVEVIVKSIRFASMDQTAFDRLFNRMLFIVTSEILPEMPEGELRAEVEKMAGVSTPEPEAPKTRRRRPRAEIPAVEQVMSGHSNSTPTAQPAPKEPPSEGAGPVSPPVTAPTAGARADAESAPASASPPSPPPAANGGAGAAPIKTAAQWAAHAYAWLSEADRDSSISDTDVMTKWRSEMAMRNDAGVTAEERQPVFERYNEILEKKRSAQAKRQ